MTPATPTPTTTNKRVGCQAGLKKTKIKSDLLTDIDMLLMAEKGIRGAIHAITLFSDVLEILEYLKYWKVNNLYGWVMLQKLPVKDFKWVEDISEFHEDFI